VSLALLLEIPGAALIAAVFLGQRPSVLAVPAAILLVGGLALVIRTADRRTAPSIPVE
jgi:drug/metabolite transporter (DMT)-like permease